MTPEIDRESYLRWQEFAITQRGYTIQPVPYIDGRYQSRCS
jgi:hypothetical protein